MDLALPTLPHAMKREESMPKHAIDACPNIFPAIRYDDAPAAIDWLIRAFGFEKMFVVPNPDGTIAHAELRLGPGVIMLGSAREDDLGMKSPRTLGGVNQSVYVYLPEVDSHYQRARAAGAEVVRELHGTDYGSREYGVRDLEGNLWSFGTYLPGDETAGS
jgi:uncharacterized glyoxalase superfamily protein PhnB